MIDFQGVCKRFGGQIVLQQASFRVNPGERVGFVGPNGVGKSTLFGLIGGEMTPDGGAIETPRRARLGFLHQVMRHAASVDTLLAYAESGVPDLAQMEGRIHAIEAELAAAPGMADAARLEALGEWQTRFEAAGGYTVRHRAEAALSGLGFREAEFGRPLAAFSGGWQMRAELARVTVATPDVLLMDEPSNYLDSVAIEWLQRFLKDFEGTLLLISHDRYLLNSLCTVIIEVAGGVTTRYAGNYDDYALARVKRREQQVGAQAKQERIRKHAELFIERFRAKNTKAAQVQSKIKMLERMDAVDVAPVGRSPGRIRIPAPPRCGQVVMTLNGVGHAYAPDRWILRGVNLDVQRGDKVAFVGLNGAGKTTLLRILAGRLEPTEGARRPGHGVTAGYQSQDFTETLDEQATVYETVRRVPSKAGDQDVRTLLGGFGFSGAAAEKRVAVLSGGERVRLAFARLLVCPPALLILDEPTTHLDIAAREALEAALAAYEGTLCVVSHDIAFLRCVAGRVVAMQPPGIVCVAGGYDYYRERLLAGRLAAAAAAPPGPAAAGQAGGVRRAARRERAERLQTYSSARREIQRQLARIEKRMADDEAEQAALTARLATPEPGMDYGTVGKALNEVQRKIADTIRRWEAFAIELDALERDYAAERDGGAE